MPESIDVLKQKAVELKQHKLDVVKKQDYEQAAQIRDKEKKLLERLEKEKIKFEKEQSENRRNNIYIVYKNETYTFYTLSKLLNLKHSTVYWRLKKSSLTPQEYFNKYIF